MARGHGARTGGLTESLPKWLGLGLSVNYVSVVGNDNRQAEVGEALDFATDALFEALAYRFKALFQELPIDVFMVHG